MTIRWKGILVFDSLTGIASDSHLNITVAVHQIEFNILDSRSDPLQLATINIYLNSSGEPISMAGSL
ncbi:MAG: hypothetical protein R6V01_09080 [Thermoplasmatota archaeon]